MTGGATRWVSERGVAREGFPTSGHPPGGVLMGGCERKRDTRGVFPTCDHPPRGLLMEGGAQGKQGKQGKPHDGRSFPQSPGLIACGTQGRTQPPIQAIPEPDFVIYK